MRCPPNCRSTASSPPGCLLRGSSRSAARSNSSSIELRPVPRPGGVDPHGRLQADQLPLVRRRVDLLQEDEVSRSVRRPIAEPDPDAMLPSPGVVVGDGRRAALGGQCSSGRRGTDVALLEIGVLQSLIDPAARRPEQQARGHLDDEHGPHRSVLPEDQAGPVAPERCEVDRNGSAGRPQAAIEPTDDLAPGDGAGTPMGPQARTIVTARRLWSSAPPTPVVRGNPTADPMEPAFRKSRHGRGPLMASPPDRRTSRRGRGGRIRRPPSSRPGCPPRRARRGVDRRGGRASRSSRRVRSPGTRPDGRRR